MLIASLLLIAIVWAIVGCTSYNYWWRKDFGPNEPLDGFIVMCSVVLGPLMFPIGWVCVRSNRASK